MGYQFKFSNLLGTVYHKGQLVFSNDGNSVYAPVGNKITCFNLHTSTSYTLPLEVPGNFTAMALSPNGLVLLAGTDDGNLYMISVMRRRIMYTKFYREPATAIAFSPDGNYFASAQGTVVRIFKCTGLEKKVFNPFIIEKTCRAATAKVTCLAWSFDSRLIAFGSTDTLTRVFPVKKMELNRQITILANNSTAIVGVHFDHKSYDLYTISCNAKATFWKCSLGPDELIEKIKEVEKQISEEEEKERQNNNDDDKDAKEEKKNIILKGTWLDYVSVKNTFVTKLLQVKVDNDTTDTPVLNKMLGEDSVPAYKRFTATASYFHTPSQMLVVACSNGDFAVIDSQFELLYSYNVSNQPIDTVTMNLSGDWVALGVSNMGQLLVWEFRSETYVLKQQGHNKSMNVVAYSPDCSCLASGGDDGKVKLWSTSSSFCYVTFSEHKDAVTGLAFTQSGKAVLSSSLDGTVRAFDLLRYRNFKTLTSPKATQFTCLAVDASGELIAAGGQDSHQIYLWSLKLGTLLEVLSGHTGPVSSVHFSPLPGSSLLASTGWDQTLMIWDSINTTQARESIRLQADGLSVKIRPDGKQVAVSTMGGHIYFFNTSTAAEEGSIDGLIDLGLSKEHSDEISATKNKHSKYFESVCYSSDGEQVLAGGVSKYLCIYNVAQQILVKKYTITQNRTLDGMLAVYLSKTYRDTGINKKLVEKRPHDDDIIPADRGIKLPGVRKGDKSLRSFRPEIRITDLSYSSTGRSFVVCCTEGLLIYSRDTDWLFDPLDAEITNTPSAVNKKLQSQEWGLALMMAIKLNINNVIQQVLETVPLDTIAVVVSNLPVHYVEKLLMFIAESLDSTKHVGVYMRWCRFTLCSHGQYLKANSSKVVSTLNALHRACDRHYKTLSKLCTQNQYTHSYHMSLSSVRVKQAAKAEEDRQVNGDAEDGSSDDEELTNEWLPSDEDIEMVET